MAKVPTDTSRPRKTAAVMLQGTGSDVGKSLLVAGLCRHFTRQGLRVRPFKPQNMSNNAGVTADGGEIGRAQMLQARACAVAPSVHMNPVLLKPQSETGAQVVVQGKVWGASAARDYAALKPKLLAPVLGSFEHLADGADLIVVEGAGSPAEINLREGDIANMGFALAASVPVMLVADIERGGVIANLVGTAAVLPEADRRMVKGFAVNKFRGDIRLFDGGVREIEARTGWRSLGVVPWFADAGRLPAEDSLGLPRAERGGPITIVVPRLPHIANFDDCDPLRLEPSVSLQMVGLDAPLPADADVVLLPGSKSTVADLRALKRAGWDTDLRAHWRRGGIIVGLCAGYQMLGRMVHDPDGLDGTVGSEEGLGFLNVETVLQGPKMTTPVAGVSAGAPFEGAAVAGYQIHMGRTTGEDRARPLVRLAQGGTDGAVSEDGRVMGCYVHGLFEADDLRAAFLQRFGEQSALDYGASVETTLDRLADHVASAIDTDQLLKIANAPVAQM